MDSPIDAQHRDTTFHRYYRRMMPDMEKPKSRAATATVFSFLAVSLFAWFAVRPTAQTIIYLRREVADKTIVNQKMEEKITALIEAQATYETIQNRLYLLENALPRNPDGAILGRQMRNLISVAEATISAIQVGQLPLSNEATPGSQLQANKNVTAFPVTSIVGGSYGSIRNTLINIIGLRRITTIQSLSLRSNGAITGDTMLEAVLRLQSYYSTL